MCVLQPIRDVHAGLLIQFSGLSLWPWREGEGKKKGNCDQEANRGQGWKYNLIFMGPEGSVSALLCPGRLSSLEMGMETARRVLGVAVPTKMGESTEGCSWGGGNCLLPQTRARPGSGGASCIDARHGLMVRGEPFSWGPYAASSSPAALRPRVWQGSVGLLCCRWS